MADKVPQVDLSSLESGEAVTRELVPDESDVPLSEVFNESAVRNLAYLKHLLSEEVARSILRLFRISTITMTALIAMLAIIDELYIYQNVIEPADRLVTEAVVMSVIGATIVQVGAASLAIVYSLFNTPREGLLQSEGEAE